MKGQYLAVESVLTFGMGLILALGTITAFANYRDGLMEKARERQVNMVESELAEAVYSLKGADSGHMSVDLPKTIGNGEYSVVFSDGIVVTFPQREFRTDLHGLDNRYSFSGSVDGGPVKVYKNGNQFTLRAD
ncbi:MAG: hypothetical protein ABEI58_00825 [Candidatus Nanohaloarchaea archaeon]